MNNFILFSGVTIAGFVCSYSFADDAPTNGDSAASSLMVSDSDVLSVDEGPEFSLALGFMHDPDHGHHHEALHFSHPLITESPSPDTKVRVDYFFAHNITAEDFEEAELTTIRFEAEYAFTPWLSVEINTPYSFINPDGAPRHDRLDTVDIGLKYANFTFADQGLLLGGGIEFGLPTGSEEKGIGSDHILDFEPFLDFGWKVDDLETIGFLSFGIPLNQGPVNEANLELGWNLSLLYHLTDRIMPMLEFNGTRVFGGAEGGFDMVNITPGIKVQPMENPNLQVGFGVSLPLTDDRESDLQTVLSVFWHF